ncbi:MAG TPA: periplasmic heavy metal sensor [Verrucomicrobiae bacterium]|nr:periplasmic heavy metal sensor [Verrucomicrobiae bacterium]
MKRTIFIVLLTGLIGTAVAQDQRPNGGDRVFPGINRVLTDPQRESLRMALKPQFSEIRALEEKVRVSRQALLDDATGGSFDEASARQDADASAQAEAELTVIFAKALSEVNPPLSAGQIQQIKSFRPDRLGGGRDAAPAAPAAPETHLPLPPELPRDSNGLPIVN